MTTTTISPFVVGEATQVELADKDGQKKKYWKKEILPSGTRKYKGQTLDFGQINPACVQAFDDGAFDAVSFVLALADNKHPETGQEIDALEGDLHKLELSDDGKLFGFFDFSASPKVPELIAKSNGKFGVSSKIEVNYERGDTGKKYPYALSHVCGTTRPHIKGMSPWEAVELSDDEKGRTTLDLSNEVIDDTDNAKGEGEELVSLQISATELAGIRKFMKDYADAEKVVGDLGKENEAGKGGGGNVNLSESDSVALTEAKKEAAMAIRLAQETQRELAETRWAKRRAELAAAGVPPVLLVAAEKVLKHPQRSTITLTQADGTEAVVDASSVIEEILEASKGVVKLGEEKGHQFGGDGDDTESAEYRAFAESVLNF